MAEVRPIAAVVRREVAAPLGAAASAD